MICRWGSNYGKGHEKGFGLDLVGNRKLLSVFEQRNEDRRKERRVPDNF